MQGVKLFWLDVRSMPIFEQLALEEALLRTDERNVCLVNMGSPKAIVLGISSDPKELLCPTKLKEEPVPVIRRFSGGGTVIIDEQTLFISFLCNKKDIDVSPFPEPLLAWSANIYAESWKIPHFSLQTQDYTIGNKKCGGNAQYIKKDRWLHHTSFLWDYTAKNMEYLTLPKKQPDYRANRTHDDFLCRLKDFAPSPDTLIERLKDCLSSHFHLVPFDINTKPPQAHRQSILVPLEWHPKGTDSNHLKSNKRSSGSII